MARGGGPAGHELEALVAAHAAEQDGEPAPLVRQGHGGLRETRQARALADEAMPEPPELLLVFEEGQAHPTLARTSSRRPGLDVGVVGQGLDQRVLDRGRGIEPGAHQGRGIDQQPGGGRLLEIHALEARMRPARLISGRTRSGSRPLSAATTRSSTSGRGKSSSIATKRWRVLGFRLLRMFW